MYENHICEELITWKNIIAVIDATFAVAKRNPEFGLYGIRTLDLCDTGAALLPIELTSQLGAGRWIGVL